MKIVSITCRFYCKYLLIRAIINHQPQLLPTLVCMWVGVGFLNFYNHGTSIGMFSVDILEIPYYKLLCIEGAGCLAAWLPGFTRGVELSPGGEKWKKSPIPAKQIREEGYIHA